MRENTEPKKVLLDLNIDGDCTNLGALALLNIFANQGKAHVLATTACFNSPLATGCIKAINHYYGHDAYPVGILHRQGPTHPTPFMKPVNEKFCPENPDGQEAPDTVDVMRKVLSEAEDNSVVLIVVGCFASFAALLQSCPDQYSSLTGQELAERKISRVVAMAGKFPIYFYDERHPWENNIKVQIPAAKYVTEHWNKEMVLLDYQVGDRIRTLKEFRFHGSEEHPLRMMYRLNDGDIGDQCTRFVDGNPTWDPAAVLEAILPGQYFTCHPFGTLSVDDEGVTTLHEGEGKHTYLLPKMPLEDIAAVINDMIFPDWRLYC